VLILLQGDEVTELFDGGKVHGVVAPGLGNLLFDFLYHNQLNKAFYLIFGRSYHGPGET
jgi:hypothetical protein